MISKILLLFQKNRSFAFLAACSALLAPLALNASESESTGPHGSTAILFLWIALLLIAAKISSLVEKWGQPSVLGELLTGVILGNLSLVGIHILDPIASHEVIKFLAELGVVVLLFQIGLESNIKSMMQVGANAFLVACVGVIAPFVLGTYVIGPLLLPDLPQRSYLFLGASLVATSVGITARVFKDLGQLQSKESRIVLGAAVIDDVLGLIILAVVSAIAVSGTVGIGSLSWIIGKSILFLAGAIVLGQLFAPRLGELFSKIHTGVGMKFTLAIAFGLLCAYLSGVIGLAPIVGAFAAGLVLDPVHFRAFKKPKFIEDVDAATADASPEVRSKLADILTHHSHRHIEDLIEPLGHFLIPLFFVITGMGVKLSTLANPSILLVAIGITIIAFIGKLIAGFVAKGTNKWLVGWGMVPRGEVGLIFATIGKGLGVVSDSMFSVIVIMIIFTTLLTPPILASLIRRQQRKPDTAELNPATEPVKY